MSSDVSLFQTESEESSQSMNLIEAGLKAPSYGTFGDYILPGIKGAMRASAAFIFIADSQANAHHFTSDGFQPEVASEIKDWCIKEFVSNSSTAQPPIRSEWSRSGVLSQVALHLFGDDARCRGLLGLRREGTPPISPDELAKTLALLARVAGRLFERAELDKKLSNLNAYLTVSSMLTQPLDLHDLLDVALNCCMGAVAADSASVLILDDEKKNFRFYQVEGRAKPLLIGATFPADVGVAGAVLKTGQPELINDIHSDPRFFSKFDTQTGFQTRNMIAIPLRAGEEGVGVLEVLNKAEGGMFIEDELLLLSSLAEEIAFAIRNAKVFEYVVNTYCRQRQGYMSCKGCKRPLGSWTPCVKYRESSI